VVLDQAPDAPAQWKAGAYPHSYRSPQRFHGPPWRPPPGYFARAWRFGERLPAAWCGADFQIADWEAYDLPAPPAGFAWVRIDADAVLAELSTGRVVQAVRDLYR
jgi:hypothetical protein